MPEQTIRQNLRTRQIQGINASILLKILSEKNGLDESLTPSFMLTFGHSPEAIHKALTFLLKGNYIKLNEITKAYEANNAVLNLDNALIEQLQHKEPPFKILGHPHDKEAMDSLEQFFLEENGPIYVATEISDPEAFRGLETRSKSGRKTTFLMPQKKQCTNHENYNIILAEWVNFINANSKVRKNIKILINRREHHEIYTSALSKSSARFDIFNLESPSTREGIIIKVENGNSLYKLIEERYRDALSSSTPYIRTHTIQWILAKVRFFSIPLLITLFAFLNYFDLPNEVKGIATLGLALVSDVIKDWIRAFIFPEKNLWKK